MICFRAGIGELIGGSQREERTDRLKLKMKEFNLNEQDYWWYLDLRRFSSEFAIDIDSFIVRFKLDNFSVPNYYFPQITLIVLYLKNHLFLL